MRFSLAHKWVVIVLALACVAAVVPLFKAVGKDFLPLDDRSEFNIVVETPPGSTLARSDGALRALEGELRRLPHVRHLLTTLGDTGNGNEDVTQASIYVGLDDLTVRKDGVTCLRTSSSPSTYAKVVVPIVLMVTGYHFYLDEVPCPADEVLAKYKDVEVAYR